jgi:hypothetical protein
MNKFRELGFINYNDGLEVHSFSCTTRSTPNAHRIFFETEQF